MTKVLIANRGEIAVRIIRAARDANISAVAIYADCDRDAMHVSLADAAFALGGERAQDTYLDIDKVLDIARRSGADAIHPGYGFLAENEEFAAAVIAANLTWIGPSPAAIVALGDKVSARKLAAKVGAPLVPGTPEPVSGVSEIEQFVASYGLPIAIKAAYGGGGRGLKVVREAAEVGPQFESAVREATAAFGRGECFVERYLDKPRHVETQCLADAHGNVVVISTRDCSLQRRHQKLVEEAPAPFLTPAQQAELYRASKAILRAANYVGAGTCEFLLAADGTIAFLEVNTRLQVEHPVSEEITGIDLVAEQFRIAAGEPLGYDDPEARGHSIEFRINGENPAVNFLPTPGTITRLAWPQGPGVRIDAGVGEGHAISGNFDSLLAKIVVTGASREQAIARARRALAETTVAGLPTVLPFHRAVLQAPDFVAPTPSDFRVHTRWIESDFMATLTTGQVSAATGAAPSPATFPADEALPPERVVVEVGGKRIEVVLPGGISLAAGRSHRRPVRHAATHTATRPATGASGNCLTAPMQGTLVKIEASNGDHVSAGDLVVVLEAMKMEQPLVAHRDGTISGLQLEIGATISAGTVICEIK